jgi:hypothetical protein
MVSAAEKFVQLSERRGSNAAELDHRLQLQIKRLDTLANRP